MRKFVAAVLMSAVVLLVPAALAQEKDEGKKPAEVRTLHYYRLDYVIRELQDRKIVNARTYSVIVADNGAQVTQKSGARLPVQTGNGALQYLDVGVQLRIRVRLESDHPTLASAIEFSSPALPGEGVTSAGYAKEQPVLRTTNVDTYAPIILGKPLVIATMDDPSLPRRFEIEVTPTQLK